MRRKNFDGDGKIMVNNIDNNEELLEYEILQGWTILAFHSLYVSLGIEYFVRFFIPFYFHLKMIVLLVTFVVPSWGGKNGSSEFGLSPVISYWFDYLIVPSVNKVHEFMDNDPKGFAKQQIANLPLLVIDFLIAPGVLTSDEDKQLARKRISNVRGANGNGEGGDKHKTPPPDAFPQPIANLKQSDELSDVHMELDEQQHQQTSDSETKDESQSAPALGDVTYIQNSFARRYEKQKTEQNQTTTKNESESMPRTPPRGQTDSSLFNNDESTPIRRSRISALTNSAILSPAVKSRLAASAKKLKRFSHEHQRKGGLLSPKRTTPRKGYEELDDDGNSGNESTIQSPKLHEDENKTSTTTRITRRKRRERLSFGDHFRELVTGDANIRVRDHLFDLEVDLPSSPRRRVRTPPKTEDRRKKGNTTNTNMDGLSPNVTRRSTRLARKNVTK